MTEEYIEHHGQHKHAYCEPCANYGLPECDRSLHNASVIGTLQAENAALRAEVERLRHFVALVQSDVEVERGWQDWERGGNGGQHAGSRPWNAWGYMVLLNFEKYLRHLKEAEDA